MSAQLRLEMVTMNCSPPIDSDSDYEATPPKKQQPLSNYGRGKSRQSLISSFDSWYHREEVDQLIAMAQDALRAKDHVGQVLLKENSKAHLELDSERQKSSLMAKADEDSGCLRDEVEQLLLKNDVLKQEKTKLQRDYQDLLAEHYVVVQQHSELQVMYKELCKQFEAERLQWQQAVASGPKPFEVGESVPEEVDVENTPTERISVEETGYMRDTVQLPGVLQPILAGQEHLQADCFSPPIDCDSLDQAQLSTGASMSSSLSGHDFESTITFVAQNSKSDKHFDPSAALSEVTNRLDSTRLAESELAQCCQQQQATDLMLQTAEHDQDSLLQLLRAPQQYDVTVGFLDQRTRLPSEMSLTVPLRMPVK